MISGMFMIARCGGHCSGCPLSRPSFIVAEDGLTAYLNVDGYTHEVDVDLHRARVLSLLDFQQRIDDAATKGRVLVEQMDAVEASHRRALIRARAGGVTEPEEPIKLKRLRLRYDRLATAHEALFEHYHDRLRDFATIVVAEQTLQKQDGIIDGLNNDIRQMSERQQVLELLAREDNRDFVDWLYQRYGGKLPDDFTVDMLNEQRDAYQVRDMLTPALGTGADSSERQLALVGAST